MLLVSIVVPIYNAEKYLEKCLQSLVGQTIEDIEILAINDGSTDNSDRILARFQRKYPDKIRAFYQENAGISVTRNRGIDNARGKYITFIDSDDSVDLRFCEKMLNILETKALDFAVCDYYEVVENYKKEIQIPECNNSTVFEKPELLYTINTSPWNKMYRTEFLRKKEIRFPINLKYEDAAFLQKILAKGARIGSVHEALVYYVVHPGSESTVVKKNVFDIFNILELICNEYKILSKEQYKKIEVYLEQFVINRVTVYNLQQIYQEDELLIDTFIEEGFEYLDTRFPEWRQNEVFVNENNFIKRIVKKNMWITKVAVKSIRKIKKLRC